MTFTTISSAARRSLVGAVAALALAVALVGFASPAKAATGSPIGKLDNASGWVVGNVGGVSGWAADPDVPLYSPINVRLDVYRPQTACDLRVCWSTGRPVVVRTLTQTADDWNSDAMWTLGGLAGGHGFRFVLDYGLGDTACVTALNLGPGSDTFLGCVSLGWLG